MKFSTIFTLIIAITILTSCASLNKGSSSFDDSDSPYVTEEAKPKVKETPKPKDIVVKEEKVKAVDTTEDEVFKYYVIIGSFKVLDNAKNYKTQLIEEGFTPVILENENGLYRVSVSAYNDEEPARNKIGNIRAGYEKYSDVWLLIRKR
ncbi:SPOR domain-containing protein [Carboxylicivirga linearis]|uniref:SPOR domain-containing protein n=1 Tax=Carboxylicivirga linearis TaxID=1628157 RepID=A0ABS5JUY0_9BACT|nr:SPOR domain-containing protein [Carboxylicivirga linearis]MBS2098600.1 SPOR domain-containing protein [Carboxylicivirga linearis]